MKHKLVDLIAACPKTELHLHLEGSLEPAMVFALAERNGVILPYASVAELQAAYQFNNLQEFLDVYYAGMSVLLHEADFYDLTWAYLQRVHQDGVVHVEVFFDPQAHLERGIPLTTQIHGIRRALEQGQAELGISFRLILSFLRHLSEESAFATLAQAEDFFPLIDGFGLDSSEKGHPPEKFARVFARCKELGFKITLHAGEEGPADYVWQALNLLHTDRIDHGNRSLEDPQLIQTLAERQMTLTVCPLSNLKLRVVQQMEQHPLIQMLDAGLKVTINSDDPAYFGGYMMDNYRALIEALPLTSEQLHQLARNAFTGSWLSPEEQQPHLEQIDALFAAFQA